LAFPCGAYVANMDILSDSISATLSRVEKATYWPEWLIRISRSMVRQVKYLWYDCCMERVPGPWFPEEGCWTMSRGIVRTKVMIRFTRQHDREEVKQGGISG